ncbi:MAG: 4-hydroxy-3-methylbut-2-enyl diphosphate reductase [uncultured bacterium]|nr:MAG: 4-hydroxy-3-methylbut-2-enyl diphosphate reductase [uncultured bacterium]
MKISVSKEIGFCFGVARAVKTAIEASNKYEGRVYMLGDIINNEIVIEMLKGKGIKKVDRLEDIPNGDIFLVRAHGVPPDTFKMAKKKNLVIIDATCPMVQKIHGAVVSFDRKGYRVVIVGDRGHDEVIGIAGEVESPIIISDKKSAEKARVEGMKLGIVSQSTQYERDVSEIVDILKKKADEAVASNTVCNSTKTRQREAARLSKENDVMIVIGSKRSANTGRLKMISEENNPKTKMVLTKDELDPIWFEDAESVGVTAGASTRIEEVDDVVGVLEEMS